MSHNVWIDLGFSEEEAIKLETKSVAFIELQDLVKAKEFPLHKLAKILQTDRRTVSSIIKGNITKLNIEQIESYLQRLKHE